MTGHRTKTAAKQERIRSLYKREVSAQTGGPVVSTAPAAPAPQAGVAEPRAEVTGRGKHTPVSNRTVQDEGAPSFGELGATDGQVDLEVRDQPAGEVAGGMETMAVAGAADESLLLDAWYAEFSDPATRAVLRNRPVGAEFLEIVLGEDDRVQVTSGVTKVYPWRCICSLRITASDGSLWIGTAWLIGPRTLATAGHCVYMHSRGGWAESIEVIPGRDGAERPFGSCMATEFRSVTGWTEDQDRDYDYGAIVLPPECPYGEQLGWYGILNETDARLTNLLVNLAGYPGDKPAGTQWFHARSINQVSPKTVVYDIDTAGGQSGAPVWVYRAGNRHGIAIHTNGALSGNSGTRITAEVYDNLVSWKNEGL
jgi:V8-like Glu-specific endopeptidase